jgi:hypothetical protein
MQLRKDWSCFLNIAMLFKPISSCIPYQQPYFLFFFTWDMTSIDLHLKAPAQNPLRNLFGSI